MPHQFQNFFPNSVQATDQINNSQLSLNVGIGGRGMAQGELQALASGSSYSFPGFAIPAATSWYLSNPGTVSRLTASRFYTASGTNITAQTADSSSAFIINWSGSGWAVNEWALMTNQGEELGQAAASQVFASGPSSSFVLTGNGAYYDAPVSSDAGFAKRSEVFFDWGRDVSGFNPASGLIPPTTSGTFGFQICTLRGGCNTEWLPYSLNYTPWGAASETLTKIALRRITVGDCR